MPVGIVGVLMSVSWLIQELLSRRRVDRIEGLILQEAQDAEVALWVHTLIKWRHERWKQEKRERIGATQRVEPIIWLIVVIIIILIA